MTEQPSEAEAKAEATSPEPEAPPPQAASPIAAQIPVNTNTAEEPAPAFVKPKGSFIKGLVDFFRAGMFGASFAMALLGMFILLDKERIFDFDRNLVIGLGTMILAPIALATARGFPGPASSKARLIGRTAGVSVAGGLVFGGLFLLLLWLDDELRLNDYEIAVMALLGGLAMFSVTWLRVRTARRRHQPQHQQPDVTRPLVVERKPGPYFWAGGLAAGLLAWLVATMIAFEASDLLPMRLDKSGPLLFMAGVLCIVYGASRGFSAELRRGLPFGHRFFLTLICSLLTGLALFAVILPLGLIFEPSKRGMAAIIAVVTFALIGAALVRGRRIAGEGRRGRIEAIGLAVVLGGLTLWPQSAWMRYALGSAEGAQALASEHYKNEDYARAATFAAVACERGDAGSCMMAAHIHRNGLGVPSSLQQARKLVMRACRSPEECSDLAGEMPQPGSRDMLLARACELGDRSACSRGQQEMLKRRCDARDAFACRALGDSLDERRPDTQSNKSSLYQRACALGDTSACSPKPMR